MIVDAKLVNGRLVDICGEPINLDVKSYIRKRKIKYFFESITIVYGFYKKSKYVAVGVPLELKRYYRHIYLSIYSYKIG